jgi:hypothetical protein
MERTVLQLKKPRELLEAKQGRAERQLLVLEMMVPPKG